MDRKVPRWEQRHRQRHHPLPPFRSVRWEWWQIMLTSIALGALAVSGLVVLMATVWR